MLNFGKNSSNWGIT